MNTFLQKFVKKEEDGCPLTEHEVDSIAELFEVILVRLGRIEKLALSLLVLMAAIGCQSIFDDTKSYTFGELSKTTIVKLKKLNETYCAEDNREVRAALIALVRSHVPVWPTEGICGTTKTVEDFLKQHEKV